MDRRKLAVPEKLMTRHSYPAYRRSANGLHFYRIGSARSFIELQLVGRHVLVHEVGSATYPEQRLIQEMLDLQDDRYIAISRAEFDQALDRSRS